MSLPWEESDDDEFDDSEEWPEELAGPEYHLNKPHLNPPEKSISELIEEFLKTL